MENLSLTIVTDDTVYGRTLGQAMIHICGQIMVQIMDKEEFFLKKHLHDKAAVKDLFLDSTDIILWDGQEAEEAYGGRIVLISADPAMAVRNFPNKKFCLYRYSPVQAMVASVFEIYSFLTGRYAANVKRQQVNLLAFSSWSGGTGCTTVAMSVAQELCRFYGKRVFYLSFEEVESTGEFIESPPGVKGVGVYLYHLFKPESLRLASGMGQRDGYPIMESYIVRDGFGIEAFAPTGGRNPLKNLSDEELGVFIASIIDSGRYDVIVMDLGNCVSAIGVSCIEMSEKICFVSRAGSDSVREEQYLQYLIRCCGEQIMEKMVKTENMVKPDSDTARGSEKTATMIETNSYIGESGVYLQEGEIRRIFLDGKFGSSIKELAEKLMKSA